jgi:signal transduction histidine kinase
MDVGGNTPHAVLKIEILQNAILNSANFAIIATDADGIIQLFNIGAERLLGYAAGDVVDKMTPSDIHDPQEAIARAEGLSAEFATTIAPGFGALVFKASRGIEDRYELTYIRKDSSRFPAQVSITALRDDLDVVIGYLLIGADNSAAQLAVTAAAEEKRAEEMFHHAVERRRLERLKDEFVSNVSHELRTPLTSLSGSLGLLAGGGRRKAAGFGRAFAHHRPIKQPTAGQAGQRHSRCREDRGAADHLQFHTGFSANAGATRGRGQSRLCRWLRGAGEARPDLHGLRGTRRP